jgi:hypothetical protein
MNNRLISYNFFLASSLISLYQFSAVHLHTFTPPGSSADNVVHTQQQLCSFRSGADNGSLELVCLNNTEFCHVADLILKQIQARACHAFANGLSEAGNEI